MSEEVFSASNEALLSNVFRAQLQDYRELPEFVDVKGLMPLLLSRNSQIIFGRSGSGKTHLLSEMARLGEARDYLPILIDLRNAGATSDVFESGASVLVRANRLAVDTLALIHEGVRSKIIERGVMSAEISSALDKLGDATSAVRMTGTEERTQSVSSDETKSRHGRGGVSANPSTLGLEGSIERASQETQHQSAVIIQKGNSEVWLHVPSLREALTELGRAVDKTLLILVDEWRSIPIDIQPYFAGLLERIAWSTPGCVMKIAATTGASAFSVQIQNQLIGINPREVSTVNLDETIGSASFDRTSFIERIVRVHTVDSSIRSRGLRPVSSDVTFLKEAFEPGAFDTLVEACEGNPGQALILAARAAQQAGAKRIDENSIRSSALTVFSEDRELVSVELFGWFSSEVVDPNRSRCFYFRGGPGLLPEPLDRLYKARLIHVNQLARDTKDGQYDEWRLDYALFTSLRKDPDGSIPAATSLKGHRRPILTENEMRSTNVLATGEPVEAVKGRSLEVPAFVLRKLEQLTKGDYLIIDTGDNFKHVPLIKVRVTVGRGVDQDVKVDDNLASREHATLIQSDSTWRIIDMKSSNGTFVRGKREGFAELSHGDMIKVGDTYLYFVQK